MWTRAELKTKAKSHLSSYYWWGVLVCLIAALLGGGSGGGLSGSLGASRNKDLQQDFLPHEMTAAFLLLLTIIILVIVILVILFSIFVGDVILVGKLNFFIKSRQLNRSAGVGRLFFGFSKGNYSNIVITMFLKGWYEFLWSLLFIIPGIMKHYEYYLVPYLLAEHPDIDRKEAFRLSKEMMNGNKFNTWVLELSFIGWYLLGLLACCIGEFFINPYYDATMTELYFKLKETIYGSPYAVTGPDDSSANQNDIW